MVGNNVEVFIIVIISGKKIADTIEAILAVAFIVLSLTISFALGDNSGIGKYVLLSILFLLLIVHVVSNKFVLNIKINLLHIYMMIFLIVCLISSLFAKNSEIALNRTIDIAEILVMISVLYICFENKETDYLLKIVMWAGYIVVLYSIQYYGIEYFLMILKSSGRVANSALNANTLGLCGAYSVVITVYFILYSGISLWNLVSLPTIAIIAASGSRKALVVLILGIVALFIIKNYEDKSILNASLKSVFTLLILAIIGFLVLQLPIFSRTLERIQTLFFAFKGQNGADSSALARIKMVEIGIDLFEKSPIIGVGIDNPQLFTAGYFGIGNYYLHNNYIELLAGVGLVGFIAYYWIYILLLVSFIMNRKFSDRAYIMTFLLLIIQLFMDIGTVTYETKLTYFYLLIFIIEYQKISKKNKQGV